MSKAIKSHPDLQEVHKKFLDLVWYARSNPASDTDYWETINPKIREGAFNAQMRVEEDYPDEVSALRGDHPDWQHGFNSGCLATVRYILDLMEGGDGGDFPELYT